MGADPYAVLGIGSDASPESIKAAYLRLAKRTHPDAPGGSSRRFREVRTAYDTLSRPAQADLDVGRDRDPAVIRTGGPLRFRFAVSFNLGPRRRR